MTLKIIKKYLKKGMEIIMLHLKTKIRIKML